MKTKPALFVLAAVAASLSASQAAAAVSITFEDLVAGTTLSNQYTGLGATFSPNAFSGAGSSTSGKPWAGNTDMTVVSSTGSDAGGLGTPGLVSGNILRSFNGWLGEDGDPSFRITFASQGATAVSMDFAGVSTPADVRLFAYNGATLLKTVTSTVLTGQFTLSYSADAGQKITSVAVTPGSFNDWVGVDNVNFTLVPVPEPETYAMMLLGLGALGLARRYGKPRAG